MRARYNLLEDMVAVLHHSHLSPELLEGWLRRASDVRELLEHRERVALVAGYDQVKARQALGQWDKE